MKRLGRLVAITAILSAVPLTAHAAPACPGGGFVVRALAEAVEPESLVVGNDGHVSRIGSCKVEPRKGRRNWPLRAKLTDCAGAPAKVTLRGRWWTDCNQLVLTLRGKKFRRILRATRSVCGDGFIDDASNEQCESASDCAPGQDCADDDCRCQDVDVLPTDDADCIPGSLEARVGLDRSSPDSDGDGVDDGAEDLDGDGLSNCDEVGRGTALDDADSDHDGASDLAEVTFGTDPLTPQFQVLRSGEIVAGDITPTNSNDSYAFTLDSARHVLIRAVDTSGSEAFTVCVAVLDAAGKRYGGTKCDNSASHFASDFPAGSYVISASGKDAIQSGSYRLQYLPLDDNAETTLPRAPDAFVDAALPAPYGLWHVYRFTVDAPRRVTLRIEARELVAGFEPCFLLLTKGGDQVPGSVRCSAVRADRDVELGAGTYYAVVSDDQNTSTGPYRLRVLQFHPNFARDLSAGAQCRALDGWGEDFDIYRIDLSAPKHLVLTQGSDDEGFTPCLRLWDESGLNLLFGSGQCTGPITLDTLPAGAYYATVHDNLRDATGSYCLLQQ